jgi:hypothetical protein
MDWSQDNFKDESKPKLHELVKMADYKKHEGEFVAYRFVGSLTPIAQVWIPIFKDGKPLISERTKKPVEVPFYPTNYDYKTGKFIEGKKCPFVELANYMSQFREQPIRVSESKLAQAINRAAQEENTDDEGRYRRKSKPSAKEQSTGFKDAIDSPCRTPVEVHTIGYMLSQDFGSILALNKVKVKDKTGAVKTVVKSIADPKYGCDVQIKFDGKIKSNKKTAAQKGDKAPLTPEEQGFLLWDLDAALKKLVLSPAEAKAEAARILAEFKKSLKAGGAKRASQEPDEEDLPDDIEDEAEDLGLDDDTPKRTQGGKTARKPAPAEDEDDLDLEMDDTPPGRTASKKPGAKPAGKPAAKKPAPADDDIDDILGDDEGEDLEGLDEDDSLPF